MIAKELFLHTETKKVLSYAPVRSLDHKERNAYDQNEQTLYQLAQITKAYPRVKIQIKNCTSGKRKF